MIVRSNNDIVMGDKHVLASDKGANSDPNREFNFTDFAPDDL